MASIKKVSNGYRVRYRDPEGRQRSRTVKKRHQAEVLKTSIEHSKFAGQYVDPSAGRITFRTYAEKWREQQPHRLSTASQVETNFRRNVYPQFGEMPIASIRKPTIEALVAKLSLELAPQL